jgi:hypothetical protein
VIIHLYSFLLPGYLKYVYTTNEDIIPRGEAFSVIAPSLQATLHAPHPWQRSSITLIFSLEEV